MDNSVETKKRPADEAAPVATDTLKKQKCEETAADGGGGGGGSKVVESGGGGGGENPQYLLKKQLEYYFSDANLSKDKFFHTKISSDENGWMDMKFILSCKKVQNMKVTQKDVITAVEGTSLEVKVDGNDVAWIRRPTPLPVLLPYERKPRDDKQQGGAGGRGGRGGGDARGGKGGGRGGKVLQSIPKTVGDIHNLGCWLNVSGIPEELSWISIKSKLNEILSSKHPNAVCYVAPVGSNGETTVLLQKFGGDVEAVGGIQEIELNGTKLQVKLVDDLSFIETIIPKLPRGLLDNREREFKTTMVAPPSVKASIQLGGSTFLSVDHLKKCYRELLDMTPPGTELKSKPFGIIRALLDYHPNKEKARDIKAIKVDKWVNEGGKESNNCFFVVREDGTCEDFSILKCISNLTGRPQFRQKQEPGSGASTSTSSPEEEGAVAIITKEDTEGAPESVTTTMDEDSENAKDLADPVEKEVSTVVATAEPTESVA